MEFMKIVHMGVNNPHLKPKPGGYFSSGNVAASAAAAAVVSAAAAAASTVGTTASDSSSLLIQRRAVLEPLSSAVVHFDYESDVLLSRQNSPPLNNPSEANTLLNVANVDDVILDDSPTAELLPSSGQKL